MKHLNKRVLIFSADLFENEEASHIGYAIKNKNYSATLIEQDTSL